MVRLLVENPLLLLFVVAGIGYPLGQVRIAGANLGMGAVLFAGLAVGALHPDLKLPEFASLLGLVLFVYTVGISSGPSFFESLRGRGLRDNAAVAALLVFAAAVTIAMTRLLGFSGPVAAGLFSGGLTSTPALASALDYLKHTSASPAAVAEPTIAYSLAYPFGVLGVIIAIALGRYLFVPHSGRARDPRAILEPSVFRVTNPAIVGMTIREVLRQGEWRAVFGRLKRGEQYLVAMGDLALEAGDLVTMVASREETPRIIAALGEPSNERIDLDRSEVDYRRILVSNREVAGRTLGELDLPGQYGAIVTRVRRGDVEFLPTSETTLHLGDRLRVITYRGNLADVRQFFGDSVRAVSEIDVLTFSLGVFAGIVIGLLPIPMPGGIVFRLGTAGGPLIIALVLGKLGRTGPMVWTLPYGTNLTIRQFGLLLFLAGIGTRAGYSFYSYLVSGQGLPILLGGFVITTTAAFGMLALGHFVLRLPFATLTGILAGLHTQPAALAFALEQSEDEAPNVGYATVYPTSTVLKVLLAQVLVALL